MLGEEIWNFGEIPFNTKLDEAFSSLFSRIEILLKPIAFTPLEKTC
jgi:hypothetical protein